MFWVRDISYETYKKETRLDQMDVLKAFTEEMLGIELDEDLFENDQDFERVFREKIKQWSDEMSQQAEAYYENLEEKQKHEIKLAESIRERSLKNIYLSLVKLLHPDKFHSSEDQSQRESIMKELNQAYELKDLFTMLNIQFDWLDQNALMEEDEENTKALVAILKDQAADLQLRKELVQMDPVVGLLERYINHTEKDALYKMEYDRLMLEKKIENWECNILSFKEVHNPRHHYIELIRKFEKELEGNGL
jgi:hypothetical protein